MLWFDTIIIYCCALNVRVPLRFTCGSPNPQYGGVRRWGLERWLGLDEVLRAEPYKKRRSLLSLHYVGHSKRQPSASQEEALTDHTGTLILDIQPPGCQKQMSAVQAAWSVVFVLAAQADWDVYYLSWLWGCWFSWLFHRPALSWRVDWAGRSKTASLFCWALGAGLS